MAELITPIKGYAFMHKDGGEPILALHLGIWDSIDNYDEITEAEYEEIMRVENEEV